MSCAPSFEQALVGCMLLDHTIIPSVAAVVHRSDFTDSALRDIASAIEALHAEGLPVEPLTVADRLRAEGLYESSGGRQFVMELLANRPSAANWEHFATLMAREAQRRRSTDYLATMQDRLQTEDPAIVLGEVQAWLDRGVSSKPAPEHTAHDLVMAGFEALRSNGAELLTIGLPPLDRMLGGLQPGRLYVPTGRTSTGKSAFMLSAMHHIADQGHSCGFFSLEMPAAEIAHRLFANRYGLNVTELSRHMPGIEAELDRCYQTRPMSMLPVVVDDHTTELQAIVARAMDWHHRHHIKVLFIDYLGLLTVRGNAPRHERIGEASRTLKLLAKRLGIPVVAACQLNREPEKQDRRPSLSDLRDSGSIEQDADVVIALNSTSEVDQRGCSTVEIGILKNRGGPRGWITESINFDGRRQRYQVSDGRQ